MSMQINPPSDLEKYLFCKQNRYGILIFGFISFILLVSGMTFFSLSHAGFFWFIFFVAICIPYLGLSYFIGFIGKNFDLEKHKNIVSKLDYYPMVDVYLPICGEDEGIILNTWKYVKELDWPKHKLQIYILDDGKSDKMAAHARDHQFNYIRRADNLFKKAGNLKNAFFKTNGEFILILDADFAPRADMLKEMIPYMQQDSKICIVQSPQFFEVASWMNWIEKGAGYVQELFYRLIQVSRNTFKGSICVGSCALYRRKALEDIGGTRQVEHSEDVWTGFSMVNKGWQIEYIPIALSKGRCPDTLKSFFMQQYRWSSGSLSLGLSKEFWYSRLTKMQKLCYFSGMLYYLTSSLGLFFVPIPGLLMLWFRPDYIFLLNSLFYFPSLIFTTLNLGIWSRFTFGFHFLKLRQVSYYAHFFALTDRLLKNVQGWVPTGAKIKVITRYEKFLDFCFYWNLTILVLLVSGVALNIDEEWWDFLPAIIFGAYNLWLNMTPIKDQNG